MALSLLRPWREAQCCERPRPGGLPWVPAEPRNHQGAAGKAGTAPEVEQRQAGCPAPPCSLLGSPLPLQGQEDRAGSQEARGCRLGTCESESRTHNKGPHCGESPSDPCPPGHRERCDQRRKLRREKVPPSKQGMTSPSVSLLASDDTSRLVWAGDSRVTSITEPW